MTENRVLFLCTQMEAAGVQTRAIRMHEALLAKGIQSEVVFLYKKRPAFDEGPTVKVIMDSPPKGPFAYIKGLIDCFLYIYRVKPTAVVGMAHYSSPLACMFGMLIGVKRRVGTQTNPPDTVPIPARFLDMMASLCGSYTANICTSQTIFDYFSKYPEFYRSKLRLVYNGVKFTKSELSKSEARGKFNLPDGNLIISTGRLSDQKNHSLLIDVLALNPDVSLAILGDGELRVELEQRAAAAKVSERFYLVGERQNFEVPHFLACGDVFAFPSRFEAFGLALVEAMMAGLPIVCSDHPALKEVAGESVLMISPVDPVAWSDQIKTLLLNGQAAKELSEKSISRGNNYSFERMLHGFEIYTLEPLAN
ncbi:glycosyltransferase family 4 protein [Asticcacaulis sp.]|uniref:glycosyltransferase family 4 protein n=1 Tax=Asticcacaulis sp. TaxID=1872648 RepID=UPI003919DBBF